MSNGFFGSIQGPFQANVELMEIIQEDCKTSIECITKLGIHFAGTYDLIPEDVDSLSENYTSSLAAGSSQTATPQIFIEINHIPFQLGKTRMLELEDVAITSIILPQAVGGNFFIDYQYK